MSLWHFLMLLIVNFVRPKSRHRTLFDPQNRDKITVVSCGLYDSRSPKPGFQRLLKGKKLHTIPSDEKSAVEVLLRWIEEYDEGD